jgi:small subunit ribosomal protein S17
MATKKVETKTAASSENSRGKRNERIGIVVSDKANKTISVEITRVIRHERYGKYMKTHRKFSAHDEKNEAKTGDRVLIVETRPLSKTKRWRLVQILEKASDKGVQA